MLSYLQYLGHASGLSSFVFVPNLYSRFSSIHTTDQFIDLDLMIITRLGEELTFSKFLVMQSSPAFYYCITLGSKKASRARGTTEHCITRGGRQRIIVRNKSREGKIEWSTEEYKGYRRREGKN